MDISPPREEDESLHSLSVEKDNISPLSANPGPPNSRLAIENDCRRSSLASGYDFDVLSSSSSPSPSLSTLFQPTPLSSSVRHEETEDLGIPNDDEQEEEEETNIERAERGQELDLEELIRLQQEAVCIRRESQLGTHSRGLLRVNTRDDARGCRRFKNCRHEKRSSSSCSKEKEKSIHERWTEYLSTLPAEFLTSKEALANCSDGAVRGKPLFSGLRLDEQNSSDMQRVFRLCFESKIRLGQPRGTYDQFRSAVGQYLRTYLSYFNNRVHSVCEPGQLFEAATNFQLVRVFLGHYQVRASATTVMGKAIHLRRLADEAVSYFTEINEQEQKGKSMSVASYLRSVASSYKTEARKIYRSRNTVDERIERGALLAPADFSRCLDKATSALDGLMRYVDRLRIEHGGNPQSFSSALTVRKGLTEKWCINFTAALVLSGGGQRPQVYAQLQLPQASELEHFADECRRNKLYFSLRAGHEKTTRSLDLPTVLFPRVILDYLSFHVLTMRPVILQQVLKKAARSSGSRQRHDNFEDHRPSSQPTLLLHTRHGRSLQSSDVKRTVSRFLELVDPELAGITPMAIRGSYASMMLQAHRRKQILTEMRESEFLDFLAKQMNTSVEQLATTYASCDMDGFEDVANEVMRLLDREEGNDGDVAAFDRDACNIIQDYSAAERLWN